MEEASLLYFDLSESYKPDKLLKTLKFQGRLLLQDVEMTLPTMTGLALAQLAASDAPGIDTMLIRLSSLSHPSLSLIYSTLQALSNSTSLPAAYLSHLQTLQHSLSLSATQEDSNLLTLASFFKVHILLLVHGKDEAVLALEEGCMPVVCLERFGECYGVLVSEEWGRMEGRELQERMSCVSNRVLQAKVNPFPIALEDPKDRLIQINSLLITALLPSLPPGLSVPPTTARLLVEASELCEALGVDRSAYEGLVKVINAKK
jgi:hypothetical protein